MSVSQSTRTKSLTESTTSESLGDPLITDRWSNNITYRQLVVSSCIGIVQLWWHPYIHSLPSLLPFLFLYNAFSVFVAYPMLYLELALGVVTKKGVLNCWDLAPMARGVGFAMLITCIFTAMAVSVVAAWSLALLVHSFHSFLPWLHCAASAQPPCAARHRPLPDGSETPAQSFFFNFVLNVKRDGLQDGLGNIVWELTIYYIISWFFIYFIAFKRIYSYSKMVLFKDVLTYFVLICSFIGVVRLEGAGKILQACDWSVLYKEPQIWREALEYALIEMTVSQGSLLMLGSYCPKQKHRLSRTTLLAFLASKATSFTSAIVLGATHGALLKDYDSYTNIWNGTSASMVLYADFVARIPGSQFWSALVFFTIFVLAISSTALLVQTIMSTFTGRAIRKMRAPFLIMICFLFGFIGVMTLCTQGGLYTLNFLMAWPVSKPRLAVAAAFALVITYLYGQTTFCEDIYFAVGEYPCVFFRVCWALTPGLLLGMFVYGLGVWPPEDWAGWLLATAAVLPITIIMCFYGVFKFRVRNIVRTEK